MDNYEQLIYGDFSIPGSGVIAWRAPRQFGIWWIDHGVDSVIAAIVDDFGHLVAKPKGTLGLRDSA